MNPKNKTNKFVLKTRNIVLYEQKERKKALIVFSFNSYIKETHTESLFVARFSFWSSDPAPVSHKYFLRESFVIQEWDDNSA